MNIFVQNKILRTIRKRKIMVSTHTHTQMIENILHGEHGSCGFTYTMYGGGGVAICLWGLRSAVKD